jgi:hypothetical protein
MATVNTECIREEVATLVSFAQSAINPNKAILVRRWSLTDPNEAAIAAADLRLRQSVINTADEKCHTVLDPMAGQVPYTGIYRGAGVKMQTNGNTYFIDQTLSLGLITEFDKTDCFIAASSSLLGNTEGSGNTASDNPEVHLMLSLEGVDPDYTQEVLASIRTFNWNDSGLSFTTADGVAISGQYHFIYAKSKKAMDETDSIEFLIARPQFTLVAYQDYASSNQSDVTYLWNVPKDLAQTVITAWKIGTTSHSASASYRGEGFVDITLYTKANADLTATAAGSPNKSDQHVETDAMVEDIETHTAAAAALPDVAFVDIEGQPGFGVITEVRNIKNEDGTFRTASKVNTSQKQQWAYSDTWAGVSNAAIPSPYGDTYWWKGKAVTSTELGAVLNTASLSGTYSCSIDIQKRDDAKFDYYITRGPSRSNTFLWAESTLADQTYKHIEFGKAYFADINRETNAYRIITYTFDVNLRHTREQALIDISGGKSGSGVESISRGGYMSKKVTSLLVGPWQKADSTTDPINI